MFKFESCPFTKVKKMFPNFSKIIDEIWEKVEKSIETSENPEFEEILEKIANFYLKELNKYPDDFLKKILDVKTENDMFFGFTYYFENIFVDLIFKNLNFTEEQIKILEDSDVNLKYFPWFISEVFFDIFLLKILQKKFPELSDKKINYIIQKNMFAWDTTRWTISMVIIDWFKKEEKFDEILRKIYDINEKNTSATANCPFFYTKNQKKWFLEIMKFFDEKIIPKISEKSYLLNFRD